jgi:hypothetical protein
MVASVGFEVLVLGGVAPDVFWGFTHPAVELVAPVQLVVGDLQGQAAILERIDWRQARPHAPVRQIIRQSPGRVEVQVVEFVVEFQPVARLFKRVDRKSPGLSRTGIPSPGYS